MRKLPVIFLVTLFVMLIVGSVVMAQDPARGTISGSVTIQDSGEALQNAVVKAYLVDGPQWPIADARTDEVGNYQLSVPYGEFYVEAHKMDYLPEWWQEAATRDEAISVTVDADNNPEGINFTLTPISTDFGSIAGTVTESGTTDPIVDAVVALHKVGDWHFNRMIHSGEDGTYLFEGLPAGLYELDCGKEGYIRAFYPDQVAVNGDDITGIDFALVPLVFGTISGNVTDATTEEPIAGARISAYIPEVHGLIAEAVSGEDGTYTLNDIPPGAFEVRCCKDGYHMQVYTTLVEVDGDDITGIDFALEPFVIGGISGIITDSVTEDPIEGAFVLAIGDGFPYHHRWAITNENGEYSLELLAGEYFLQVYAMGYVRYHAEDPIVVGDEVVENVNVGLIPLDFGSIAGTVYNSDNEPIANAVVTLSMRFGPRCIRTTTDENGNYLFEHVYPGNYRLVAFANNYSPQAYDSLVVVENGSDITGIDFYLEPFTPPFDGFISGVVTDETTGDPIAGASVMAIELGNHHWFRVRHTHTLADGSYIFNYMPDHEYKVMCFARDYIGEFYDNKTNWSSADIVTPDAENIDFALAAVEFGPRVLSGQVTEQGLPVDGAVVLVLNGEEIVGITACDPEGYYFLDNLQPADYTIQVIGPDDIEGSIIVSAVTEDVYEADIILSPTSVDNDIALPAVTKLTQNYPNPFNATTNISFYLANAGEVELSVYDLLGRKVSTLVASNLPAGNHMINWNGLDNNGQQVSSGMYLYILKTANVTLANRMMLLK